MTANTSSSNSAKTATYCAVCNYEALFSSKLTRHQKTDKHKLNVANLKIAALEREVQQLKLNQANPSTMAPNSGDSNECNNSATCTGIIIQNVTNNNTITNNNNTITNNNTTNHNHVSIQVLQINDVDKTNMSHLTAQDWCNLIHKRKAASALFKRLHVDANHPENHNMVITNWQDKRMWVKENGRFVKRNKRDSIVDELERLKDEIVDQLEKIDPDLSEDKWDAIVERLDKECNAHVVSSIMENLYDNKPVLKCSMAEFKSRLACLPE